MLFRDIQATIEIDLGKDLEELWGCVDKDGRWGVNKARKENLEIDFANSEEEIKEFYDLYKETMVYSKLVPKSFVELKKDIDKLFLCKKDGKIIAGAAVKLRDSKTILFLNASNHEYLKYQPNNLLYWSIIEWSKNNGYKIYDLGGYQLNAKIGSKLYEINKFKKRWGGKIKIYYVRSNNPFYILGRKIIRNSPKIKKLREEIKFRKWEKLKNESA